jgi:archaellum component FlaF (FlaF/FlaG flagellin family)
MKRGKLLWLGWELALLALTGGLAVPPAQAATLQKTAAPSVAAPEAPHDFNLQVTPSPIVTTVTPGVKSTQNLKIYNNGTAAENLKIEPRTFTYDSDTGHVSLNDTAPPDIADWISFAQPKFTIQPGQSMSNQIILNVPKTAGFSYSFAVVITRQNPPKPAGGTREVTGSLAIFTLVNVNRPGATSSLEVSKFSVAKHVYEYLPASFSIRFSNNGNTITQPYGNLFIQRGSGSASPLASLTVNQTKGYILPGTERTLTVSWNDGFPHYKTITGAGGKQTQKLIWDWGNLSKLRIGRYTAHLVAVYNQAGRDVPIEGTVSFWVIPWKILLTLTIVVLLVLFALFVMTRSIVRFIRRKVKKQPKNPPPSEEPEQKV